MQILTCIGHHALPFWATKGVNTDFQLLDFRLLHSMKYGSDIDKEHFDVFQDSEEWRILKAISEIDIEATAYVSIILDYKKNLWSFPKRVWIQFSDMPRFIDGIPQVFSENGNPLVQSMWLNDNGTYHPCEFLKERSPLIKHSVDFWKDFFMKSLLDFRDKKIAEALKSIAQANNTIQLYNSFPSREELLSETLV